MVARIVEIVRERSERFAAQAPELQALFTGLRSRARGRHPFLDLALGVDGHIRRHLVPLAAARKRILSYLEAGDLMRLRFDGIHASNLSQDDRFHCHGRCTASPRASAGTRMAGSRTTGGHPTNGAAIKTVVAIETTPTN